MTDCTPSLFCDFDTLGEAPCDDACMSPVPMLHDLRRPTRPLVRPYPRDSDPRLQLRLGGGGNEVEETVVIRDEAAAPVPPPRHPTP